MPDKPVPTFTRPKPSPSSQVMHEGWRPTPPPAPSQPPATTEIKDKMKVHVTITFDTVLPVGGDINSARQAIYKMISPELAWPQLMCDNINIKVKEAAKWTTFEELGGNDNETLPNL